MEETQEEERDVLRSIYDGDQNFKEINPSCFQYKYGDEQECKAFILEIHWPNDYPAELPTINMDAFFNKNLPLSLKEEIKSKVLEQAEEFRDCPMTYSLFDWMNENSQEYVDKIPDGVLMKETAENGKINEEKQQSQLKEKKEILTKAQKRRITDRTNFKGERERGWNWVDVVKHLNQTGAQ